MAQGTLLLMNRSPQLARPGSCEVRFWDFALPVAFGSIAGMGAGMAARMLMSRERSGTQEAAAGVAHAIAFWTFGGLTFVLRQRFRH